MRCLLPLYEILLPEAIMSVARSRLIQRFGRDWMIYALFHCGVEYLISQNSGFWDSLYLLGDGPVGRWRVGRDGPARRVPRRSACQGLGERFSRPYSAVMVVVFGIPGQRFVSP